jgi:hypothetical protein
MNFQQKYSKQIKWLLKGDPAIRFQTLRDLTDSNESDVNLERKRILKEGWGKRLIDLHEENGTWSNALYSPKWTSTFYTLQLLKRFGAINNEKIEKACRILLDKGFYKPDGGINYWKTWQHGECCVTGMLLSILCFFQIKDDRVHPMVEFLLSQQMPDNGWNCDTKNNPTHSSFHTTISVLEGLWDYEKEYPASNKIKAVRRKQDEGIEFLLQHHLYKSNTTWKPVNRIMTKLSFPPRWHFDIIRCLDHFHAKNVRKDTRMNDAMDLLTKKQTNDGFWKLEHKYPAKAFFDMEKVGQPSRWNTLRALRIIKWWKSC